MPSNTRWIFPEARKTKVTTLGTVRNDFCSSCQHLEMLTFVPRESAAGLDWTIGKMVSIYQAIKLQHCNPYKKIDRIRKGVLNISLPRFQGRDNWYAAAKNLTVWLLMIRYIYVYIYPFLSFWSFIKNASLQFFISIMSFSNICSFIYSLGTEKGGQKKKRQWIYSVLHTENKKCSGRLSIMVIKNESSLEMWNMKMGSTVWLKNDNSSAPIVH